MKKVKPKKDVTGRWLLTIETDEQGKGLMIRSHFGSAISCSNVHDVFPFTSLSGFVLSKCLQPSFVVSFFSCHVRVTEQMCRSLRRQPSLRIWVLLTVLFLTLKGQDFAPVRWRRNSTKPIYSYRSSYRMRLGSKIASRRLLKRWLPSRPRL